MTYKSVQLTDFVMQNEVITMHLQPSVYCYLLKG